MYNRTNHNWRPRVVVKIFQVSSTMPGSQDEPEQMWVCAPTFWLPPRPGCAHTRAYATLGSTSPASSELCQPQSVFSLILLLRLLLFTVSPAWLMLNCYLLHLPSSSQIFPSFFSLLKWLNGSMDFFYGANHYLPHCAFVLSYLPQPRLSPHTTAK